jgi:hypothetical protein
MERCQSLKTLTMKHLALDEPHSRVLGTYSRSNLEIVLDSYDLTSAGTSALVEVLGRNQGPTELLCCDTDYYILADGLRGNSRLKSLVWPCANRPEDDKRDILAIAGALRENIGLVELNLKYILRVSDEMWSAICGSLETHPTLQVLHLLSTDGQLPYLTPVGLKSRVQALVVMMKVNMSIHTIRLTERDYSEDELYRASVIPYLATNRLRPHVRAIQKTSPIAYRAKVLGRALLAVRDNANSFWMLLSGNAEVAFPSTTVTTTPAANVPTPATIGASAKAATVVANPVATGTPAVKVAAPASSQKRKAHP